MIELLDYPEVEIRLHVSTEIERTVRAHSCKKESETVAWLQTLGLGDVLYDVGANVGAYTMIAISRGVEVVAFEPAPANASRLRENLSLNKMSGQVLELALHDEMTIVTLTGEDQPGSTHSVGGGVTQAIGMPLDTAVSRYGLSKPTAIKIDVDGHEIHVVEGAARTLESVETVLVETTPRTAPLIDSLLAEAGLWPSERYLHRSGVTNHIYRRV